MSVLADLLLPLPMQRKRKRKKKRKEWIYIGGLFAPSNNNQERLGPSENRASHAHGPLAEDKHFPRVHDVTIFQIGFFISFDLTKWRCWYITQSCSVHCRLFSRDWRENQRRYIAYDKYMRTMLNVPESWTWQASVKRGCQGALKS